ncbi:hypothetical protein DEO72_LG6g1991 [Vigna unguiculata]|uniref:Uncharacterized protein n=1 Tax=Vigna unguiculata TaxID=3917 RepID=A0A4D6MA58_VIGUN|nr:hypothetical protein DEO72_LG6g1991 [Vigna unguiculata]
MASGGTFRSPSSAKISELMPSDEDRTARQPWNFKETRPILVGWRLATLKGPPKGPLGSLQLDFA